MKTLTSNLWVKGKPPLLSSWDYAKLALIKIPADEVHWRGTSHSTGTISNPHPDASEQLPTAEISHARDIPLPPEPILAPHMFDFFASKHIASKHIASKHIVSLSGFLREDVSIHRTNLKYCGKSPKIRFHYICSCSSKILRIIVNPIISVPMFNVHTELVKWFM